MSTTKWVANCSAETDARLRKLARLFEGNEAAWRVDPTEFAEGEHTSTMTVRSEVLAFGRHYGLALMTGWIVTLSKQEQQK